MAFFPLSMPVSQAREPACIIPGPLNLNWKESINYTCALSAPVCQHVSCEMKPVYLRVNTMHKACLHVLGVELKIKVISKQLKYFILFYAIIL